MLMHFLFLVLTFLLISFLISFIFLLPVVDVLSVMLPRVFLKLGDNFLNRFKHLLRLVDSKLQQGVDVQELQTLNVVEPIICKCLHLFFTDWELLENIHDAVLLAWVFLDHLLLVHS